MDESELSTEDRNCLPPIGIKDILILTAAMAFLLMLQSGIGDQREYLDQNPVLYFVLILTYVIPIGLSLAAIYWIIVQKRLTGKFFQQPGHWLLAGYAIPQIVKLVFWLPYFRISGPINDATHVTMFGIMTVTQIGATIVISVGISNCRGIWRWVLVGVAASSLIVLIGYITNLVVLLRFSLYTSALVWLQSPQFAIYTISGIIVVLLPVAISLDRYRSVSRDWLHWVGVTLLVFECVVFPVAQRTVVYFY